MTLENGIRKDEVDRSGSLVLVVSDIYCIYCKLKIYIIL